MIVTKKLWFRFANPHKIVDIEVLILTHEVDDLPVMGLTKLMCDTELGF